MIHISMHSVYGFKEDYCRTSIWGMYEFNMFCTMMDVWNKERFNSDKMSWKSYYYLDVCEGDSVCYCKVLDRIR